MSYNKCPVLEFKVLQNGFKIKRRLKISFKVINRNYYTIKEVFLRLFGFYAALYIRDLEDWRIGEFDF